MCKPEDVCGDTYGGQNDPRALGAGVTDYCDIPLLPLTSHKITVTCVFLLVSEPHPLSSPRSGNQQYLLPSLPVYTTVSFHLASTRLQL